MYELQLQTPQHHQILQAVDATGLWTPPGCGRHRAVDAISPNPAFPFTQTHLSSAAALKLPPEADQSRSQTFSPLLI